MSEKTKLPPDALLDGLVFARDLLWNSGENSFLRLLENRLRDRYNIGLWDLRSPVEGDNVSPIRMDR